MNARPDFAGRPGHDTGRPLAGAAPAGSDAFAEPTGAAKFRRILGSLRPSTRPAVPALPVDRVLLGDCSRVLRTLPDACVDFVLTDPPYLVGYRDRSGRAVPNDDNDRWMYPAFSEVFRVMRPDTYLMSFYGWGRADRFLTVWRECGFAVVGHFVWVKGYASAVKHAQMRHEQAYLLAKGSPKPPAHPPSDVQPWRYSGNKLHPTQKPVAALVPAVEAYSKPGDLILDPFGGSGSTGVAARKCSRRYLLVERDPEYYRLAKERLSRLASAPAA